MLWDPDEALLEISALQRQAMTSIRERMARQQHGEDFRPVSPPRARSRLRRQEWHRPWTCKKWTKPNEQARETSGQSCCPNR
jgi:hypothetical protein